MTFLSLIMLMIIKEDKIKTIERKQKDKVDSLANDAFFSRNYNSSNKIKSNFGHSSAETPNQI